MAFECDEDAGQWVYELPVHDQEKLMRHPWPEDVAPFMPRWELAWNAIQLTAVENREVSIDGVPFVGEVTGGGGGSESTRLKDATMTKLFRIVGDSKGTALKTLRKKMPEFITKVEEIIVADLLLQRAAQIQPKSIAQHFGLANLTWVPRAL